MIVVAVFFVLFFSFFALLLRMIAVICFAVFIRIKNICKSSDTSRSSAHFANIWHADKTEVATVPFEKKKTFKLLLQFTLFETLI